LGKSLPQDRKPFHGLILNQSQDVNNRPFGRLKVSAVGSICGMIESPGVLHDVGKA
jgi:hypothetical protein